MSTHTWDPAGKRVLVTGASSGIGAATAVEFAKAGAIVAICARREDRLAETLAACREYSPESELFVDDLSRLDEVEPLAHWVLSQFGPIDVLVNNAGIPKRRRVADMTPQDVEKVMAMNYFSPVRLTLGFLPNMVARGTGHIVNVSSMGAHMVSWGTGAYSATKAALELFTEAIYLELEGSGVHAHLVVPGTTDTEFSSDRKGNDKPFPVVPGSMASPQAVAESIIGCVSSGDFITYVTERDRGIAAKKSADPNAFLMSMRERLSSIER